MILELARKVFGTPNDRILKSMQPRVNAIGALEADIQNLSDTELKDRVKSLREQAKSGTALDDLIVETYACVREAGVRALGIRAYDAQLLGGIALHQGKITEMKTGEGKTLVAAFAATLNALSGKGVHVVTVNDYLARRDSEWMGRIYERLGLSVGCLVSGISDEDRKAAYQADMTYGTNNEFGFDYLRDNMKFSLEEMVQRPFNFVIVDEVDSILIDEARTPLIISGPAADHSEQYQLVNKMIPELNEQDYEVDEKARSITLTEDGTAHAEDILKHHGLLAEGSLYDMVNMTLLHSLNACLRAHKLFKRDTHYIVRDDKIVLIDEFTGRAMEGRRYSDGLHQALEAKENVTIQAENQTLASTTYQNYFRLYPTLCGMTGTALTEATEFDTIYGLPVVEIPTHEPVVRIDHNDEVYQTLKEKNIAVVNAIEDCTQRGQPVLVGTVSIEKSEELSTQLTSRKIKHHVLNARHHEQEAYIIAQAGEPKAVTIATNMAGRGTDIKLGGNAEMRILLEAPEDAPDRDAKIASIEAEIEDRRQQVLEAGGLYVIGTERHESRRIDNQLRGRSGRQGDPGASKFYLSLDDDLLRIFGSERMASMLERLGLEEGEAIEHPWINKALEKAQTKVEAHHFESRKTVLKYDDVMNDQRRVVYEQRRDLMATQDVSDTIAEMRTETLEKIISDAMPEGSYFEQWQLDRLEARCLEIFSLKLPVQEWGQEEGVGEPEILNRLTEAVARHSEDREAMFSPEVMRSAEKSVLLYQLDQLWKEHLLSLDQLRQGIHLRGYGQRDPLNEYKREAFTMFEEMLDTLRLSVTQLLSHLQIEVAPPEELMQNRGKLVYSNEKAETSSKKQKSDNTSVTGHKTKPSAKINPLEDLTPPFLPQEWAQTSRNAPCPCNSGIKFKHCHGRV